MECWSSYSITVLQLRLWILFQFLDRKCSALFCLGKFAECTSGILEVLEVSFFFDCTVFKEEDLAALLNSTHSMSNDNSGSVRHSSFDCCLDILLRSLVKSRSSLIEKKNSGLSNESSSNSYSLFLTSRELSSLDATLSLVTLVESIGPEGAFSIVDVTFNSLELSFLLCLNLKQFKNCDLFIELLLSDHFHDLVLVCLHFLEEICRCGIDSWRKILFLDELNAICLSCRSRDFCVRSF